MTGKSRRTSGVLAAAVAIALGLAACGSDSDSDDASGAAASESAQTFEFKYAAQNPETSTYGVQAKWWIDEVAKQTDNRVKFQTFFNSTLAGPTELLKTVEDGRVEFSHIPAGYYPAELPLSQVAGVPFVYNNTGDSVAALYKLYAENADFRNEYEQKHKIKVLAWAPNPNMSLGAKTPLNGLDDLKGKKIRVVGLSANALQAVGVEPVAMALPEVLEALQRGVLDGYSGLPLSLAKTNGITAVAKYILDTGIGTYTMVPVVVANLDAWAKIPADIQKVMEDAGAKSVDAGLTATGELEKAACDDLLTVQKGTVKAVPEAEVTAWKNQVQPGIIDKWVSDVTKAGVTESVARGFFDAYAGQAGKSGSTYEEGLAYCAKKAG